MAQTYVLDTGVLVLLGRGKGLATTVAGRYGLLDPGARPLISIVTHGELWAFIERNGWGEAKASFVRTMLSNVITVEISQPVIEAYVRIDNASRRHIKGAITMGKNDLWIAATALAARATLITTDRDYDHLHPEVIERVYVDPKGAST